jgi:hypothetical protein
MGIRVEWDNNEQTIIRYSLEGHWTWDDLLTAVATSNAMLDAAGRKIHFIHDATTSKGVPNGALTHLRRFIGKEHPNTGRSVIVGAQGNAIMLARGLLGMVDRFYKKDWDFMFADTVGEARELLAKLPHPVVNP